MDYQSYEDYMRQVLGYSPYNPNIYETYDYGANQYNNTYYRNDNTLGALNDDFDELYPEIYHIVNPIVCKVCSSNTQPITKDLLEKMTDEVYNLVENNDTIVNVRVETKKNETNNNRETRNNITERTPRRVEPNSIARTPKDVESNYTERANRNLTENINSKVEQTSQTRQLNDYRRNNQTLRDLIKILILKQLLGGNRPPTRPPRPNYPPYLGGSGVIPRTPYN